MFVFFLKTSPAKYEFPFPSARHHMYFIFFLCFHHVFTFGSAFLRQEEHHLFKVIMPIGIMIHALWLWMNAAQRNTLTWQTSRTRCHCGAQKPLARMWTWMVFVSFISESWDESASEFNAIWCRNMYLVQRVTTFLLMSFTIRFPCRTSNEEETCTRVGRYQIITGWWGNCVHSKIKLDQIYSI